VADKRAYLWLLFVVVALALALTAVTRAPGRRVVVPSRASAPETAATMALEVRNGTITPAVTQARKGDRLALHVVNAGTKACTLALMGYEDRMPPMALAPGAAWDGILVADRPGEDFAWMIDGAPAGRFEVAGSHLVEGHR